MLASQERQQKIAALLRDQSKRRGERGWPELPSPVTALVKNDPFAFLLAACLDRSMPWVKAWTIPWDIKQAGFLQVHRLASMQYPDINQLLASLPTQHRYPKQAAKTIVSAANLVRDRYNGDAASIWRDSPVAQVTVRLKEIWGVGPGLAAMTVRTLHDHFGYFHDQEAEINVKPDVLLVRVFQRAGLTRTDMEDEAIAAARRLNPEYPAALDWAWHVGRRWCKKSEPKCGDCLLSEHCLYASRLEC